MLPRPDVLVLGAGGTLGEAWMRGLLDGIAAGSDVDFRQGEYLVGTSAGSIVAAALAAGQAPDAGAKAAQEWAEAAAEAETEGAGDAETGGGRGLGGRLGGAARGVGRAGIAAATPFVPAVL